MPLRSSLLCEGRFGLHEHAPSARALQRPAVPRHGARGEHVRRLIVAPYSGDKKPLNEEHAEEVKIR